MKVNDANQLRPSDLHRDSRKIGRRAWHDSTRNPVSLGCASCRDRSLCGGIAVEKGVLDCLSFCCGQPATCDRVCRRNPAFVHRIWEVDGLSLATVPRYQLVGTAVLPPVISLVFHGGSRAGHAELRSAVLPLYAMLNRADGAVRFQSRDELVEYYRVSSETEVILTGTDQDPPLERWWALGESRRRVAIRELRRLGVTAITTPNYSLIADRPRWDDMHAMKRIAQVHWELGDEGVTAVLHVNARTETDMRRWADYIGARPEITHVAYEFTTGTRYAARRELHMSWLEELAGLVPRPLHIVVRGGLDLLPRLQDAFERVTIFETSAFMKTMMRRRATLVGERLRWQPAPTVLGDPLDALLDENIGTTNSYVLRLMARHPTWHNWMPVPA